MEKEQYKVGDLVKGLFGQAQAYNYGIGIIIQHKNHTPHVNAYRVHWSNYHPTWEAGRQLLLVARA
jgi:hypothetical protein